MQEPQKITSPPEPGTLVRMQYRDGSGIRYVVEKRMPHSGSLLLREGLTEARVCFAEPKPDGSYHQTGQLGTFLTTDPNGTPIETLAELRAKVARLEQIAEHLRASYRDPEPKFETFGHVLYYAETGKYWNEDPEEYELYEKSLY